VASTPIFIFADGACENNPGRGGWAALLRSGTHEKTVSGGYRNTTNNRMELRAVIEGLKTLKREGCEVRVVSDSQYVVQSVSAGWLDGWAAKQFKKKGGFRENSDLWIELRALLGQHRVTFEWIRGHAGHPENEACDLLAVAARRQADLPADIGFEDLPAAMSRLGMSLL
jgi:ribonuclease HI